MLFMLLLAGEKLPREVSLLDAHTSPGWAVPPASPLGILSPETGSQKHFVFSANCACELHPEVLLPVPVTGGDVARPTVAPCGDCDRSADTPEAQLLCVSVTWLVANLLAALMKCCLLCSAASMVMFTNDLRSLAPFPIPFPSPTSFPLFYFLLLEA